MVIRLVRLKGLGAFELLAGLVEPPFLPIKLRQLEIGCRVVRVSLQNLLKFRARGRSVSHAHQRVRISAAKFLILGVLRQSLFVGGHGGVIIVRLAVRVAQHAEQRRIQLSFGDLLEQLHRARVVALLEIKLRQAAQALLRIRVHVQDLLKGFFGLFGLVVHFVEAAREPARNPCPRVPGG